VLLKVCELRCDSLAFSFAADIFTGNILPVGFAQTTQIDRASLVARV
jgi:hypothetical protein